MIVLYCIVLYAVSGGM